MSGSPRGHEVGRLTFHFYFIAEYGPVNAYAVNSLVSLCGLWILWLSVRI